MMSEFLRRYFKKVADISKRINSSSFESLIEELENAYKRGARIFICGNGGSASTASHITCDINKGLASKGAERFKVICLNDNIPTIMAYANDMSYNDIFVEQLKNFMEDGDLLIGISGSGNSENVVRAIAFAKKHGATTFGICGYGGGRVKKIAGKSMVVHSDDMQKVEDIHLMVLHCAMQWFYKSLTGVK